MVHDPPNSLPLSLPFPASVQSSSSRTLRCSCSEIRWLSLIRWHRGLHGTPCHPPIPGETSIFVARPLLFHRKNRAKFLGVAAIYERWMEYIYIYFGWWIQVEVINKYHLRIGPWDLSLFHWGRRPTKTVLPGKRWSIPKGMWFLPWKEIPDVEKYTRYNHPLKKSDIGRKLPKKWIKMTGSSCGWLVDAKKKSCAFERFDIFQWVSAQCVAPVFVQEPSLRFIHFSWHVWLAAGHTMGLNIYLQGKKRLYMGLKGGYQWVLQCDWIWLNSDFTPTKRGVYSWNGAWLRDIVCVWIWVPHVLPWHFIQPPSWWKPRAAAEKRAFAHHRPELPSSAPCIADLNGDRLGF